AKMKRTLPLGLVWRESRMKLATSDRNMALDIINFVIQSFPNSGRCWKAKIVHENNHSELDPTSLGNSRGSTRTVSGSSSRLCQGVPGSCQRQVEGTPSSPSLLRC